MVPGDPVRVGARPGVELLLALLSGDLIAIGAAAAFARIGEAPLWLVVVAGVAGMVKFDVIAWWAGRRWGAGIIGLLTVSPRVQRWARRGRDADPRVVRAAVVLAVLPGVPSAVVFALAGWSGLRWTVFLLLDAVGALAMTGLVAGLGYGLGQHAVDVVLLVDRYASAVSLTLVAAALALPLARRLLRRPGRA